jgi:hypothetical protein
MYNGVGNDDTSLRGTQTKVRATVSAAVLGATSKERGITGAIVAGWCTQTPARAEMRRATLRPRKFRRSRKAQ